MGADSSKEESRSNSPEQSRRRNQYVRQQRYQTSYQDTHQSASQSPPHAPTESAPYSYTAGNLQDFVRQSSPDGSPGADYNNSHPQHVSNQPNLYPNLNASEEYVYVQRSTPQPSAPPASEVESLPKVPTRPQQSALRSREPPKASKAPPRPPPPISTVPRIPPTTRLLVSETSSARNIPPRVDSSASVVSSGTTIPPSVRSPAPLVRSGTNIPPSVRSPASLMSLAPNDPHPLQSPAPLMSSAPNTPHSLQSPASLMSSVSNTPHHLQSPAPLMSSAPNTSHPLQSPAPLMSSVSNTPHPLQSPAPLMSSVSNTPHPLQSPAPLMSSVSNTPHPLQSPAPLMSSVSNTPHPLQSPAPLMSSAPNTPHPLQSPAPLMSSVSNTPHPLQSPAPLMSSVSNTPHPLQSPAPLMSSVSNTPHPLQSPAPLMSSAPNTPHPLQSPAPLMSSVSNTPHPLQSPAPLMSLALNLPHSSTASASPFHVLEIPAIQTRRRCEPSPHVSPRSTQSPTASPNAQGSSQFTNFSANKIKPRPAARNRTNNDGYSCPTCGQRLGITVYQCLGGHSCCKDCRLAERACGSCHSTITDMRNIALEALIAELTNACQNPGCSLSFNAYEMERHLKECPFGEMDCPMGTFFGQCSTRCKVADMAAHFDACHKEHRTAEIDKEMYVFNICMETHKLFLIKIGPHTFLFHLKVHEQERKISMTVQLLGTKISAGKWSYEFHVYNKRQPLRKYLYVDSCQSISTPVDDIFKESQCATLPLAYAMTFVNESALTYKFYIKKEMNQRGRRGPRKNAA